MAEKGTISINAENIMPVIKRWLYSDKDIFVREMVSNGCDAVRKHQRLAQVGEAEPEEHYRVDVILNKEEGTVRFVDNGIGMTAEEVKKYIAQVAFSGAEDFLSKYKPDEGENGGIIGHFGLGFYSAFMAADKVTIDTLSYQDGASPVLWESEDGMAFTMRDGGRTERGTTIILHIMEDEKEFLDGYRVREVLDRYCGYMSVPIYLQDLNKDETKKDPDEPTGTAEEEKAKEEKPINDTHPLWLKNPKDCTEEEYKETYRKLFHTFEDPLFWVHLNVDYPFNLKGILYFPRIKRDFGGQEGEIKLFNRQVFVADNIKEVIPEFLMLLKGVIDCPDLPLNVSRSFLQNDGYVKKISAHITKKVADKLNSMFTNEREAYEKIWRDLKTFVEYGSLRDRKFFDRVKGSVLLETTDGSYKTIDEYLEAAKEKHENKIYYATDVTAQSKYVKMFRDEGIEVAVLDRIIDTQFVNVVEETREGVKFARIDAEIADVLKEDGEKAEYPAVADLFRSVAGEHTKVEFERFKDGKTPAVLNVPEEMRRMNDMMKLYRMGGDFPLEQTLLLNTASPLIAKLADMAGKGEPAGTPEEGEDKPAVFSDDAKALAKHIYLLASLSQRQLTADELVEFLPDSYDLLNRLD